MMIAREKRTPQKRRETKTIYFARAKQPEPEGSGCDASAAQRAENISDFL